MERAGRPCIASIRARHPRNSGRSAQKRAEIGHYATVTPRSCHSRIETGTLPRVGEPQAPADVARRKPTHASVTDLACTCGYLERRSSESRSPIVFDETVNEYHIENVGKNSGHLVIYHCPFCGGTAPQSKRASLFAVITHDESARLQDLAAGFKSIAEAVKKLGKPDGDLAVGISQGSRPSESEAPTVTSYRTLTYTRLSKSA
jgi:hypothetical protein